MPPDESSPDVESLLRESTWLDSLAQGLLADENDARDVAQEARVAALEKAPADATHARAWLVRVTRHLAFKTLRSRSRRNRREARAATTEATPATVDVVARVNAQRRVVDAVLELEEPYRTVVLLRYFESLEPIEIARRRRSPPATIRTQLHRALAQLRQRLDAEFGDRSTWAALLLPSAKGAAALATTATTSVATKLGIAAAAMTAGALVWYVAVSASKSSHTKEAATGAASTAVGRAADGAPLDASTGGATRHAEASDSNDTTRARVPVPMRFVGRIVDARDRKPIAGATIEIQDVVDSPNSDVGSRSTSDTAGRFDFVVDTASWSLEKLEVRSPGFARWIRGNVGLHEAIDVRKDRRLDFGDIEMLRGASVRGRVVRDSGGGSVEGAELRVYEDYPRLFLGHDFTAGVAHPAGTSGRNGAFELAERVETDSTWPIAIFAVHGDELGWASLDLDRATESVDDVEVVMHRKARLEVIVRDVDRVPVPSARVWCMPHFAPLGPSASEGAEDWIRFDADARFKEMFDRSSGSDGTAVFARLPVETDSGTYDVFASKDGFVEGAAYEVNVATSGDNRVEIELMRAQRLRVSGTVEGVAGVGIANVKVHCRWARGDLDSVTDAGGGYSFDDIPTDDGWYDIELSKDGYFDVSLERKFESSMRRGPGANARADATELHDRFTLFRRVELDVLVLDESGAPVPRPFVSVEPVRKEIVNGSLLRSHRQSGHEPGRAIYDVPEGREWIVEAAAPIEGGYLGVPMRLRVPGDVGKVVIHCPTRAPEGARVSARAVEMAGGRTVRIMSAVVTRSDGLQRCGACRIDLDVADWIGIPPGRWRMEVEAFKDHRGVQEFEVSPSDHEIDLTIPVGEVGRVDGLVQPAQDDAESNPLEGFRVAWTPRTGHAIDAGGYGTGAWDDLNEEGINGTAQLDSSGRFQAAGFVPGESVHLIAEGKTCFDETTITPKPGERRSIVLHPAPAARWTLHCPDDLSSGIIAIDLATGDEPWHRELLRDHEPLDADAVARPLKPGHHRWRALYLEPKPDEPSRPVRTIEGEFDVAAGETATIELKGLR